MNVARTEQTVLMMQVIGLLKAGSSGDIVQIGFSELNAKQGNQSDHIGQGWPWLGAARRDSDCKLA